MPAGPVGSVWAAGSWSDTAWEAGSWAGDVPGGGSSSVMLLLLRASVIFLLSGVL